MTNSTFCRQLAGTFIELEVAHAGIKLIAALDALDTALEATNDALSEMREANRRALNMLRDAA